MTEPFEVVVERATAGELHAASAGLVAGGEPARRVLRVMEATEPCVVLGSTQPPTVIDTARLAAVGWEVTRRRSGGSAVVVGPDQCAWVDVVVPAGDSLWDADIGRASWWLGDAWARALELAGLPGALAWRGPMRPGPWSDLVCFAGLGPGEVTVGGRKVVGVSQRRTRAGVLFQCALLVRWEPQALLGVLALDAGERADAGRQLGAVAAGVGADIATRALTELCAAAADW